MRVNSLVQKTVVLVYITIPSIDSFPATMRKREGDGGGLEYGKVGMKGLLERYSVREVSLVRKPLLCVFLLFRLFAVMGTPV
jgi:tRNA-splicing endonuclease subunit Sen2